MSRVLPILFNTDMVRAMLDGRKTVTRRLIKGEIILNLQQEHTICYIPEKPRKERGQEIKSTKYFTLESFTKYEAPYQPGDILYVRETWNHAKNGYRYKADWENYGIADIAKWHPSIHMPKEAARIWLRVTDVRVERLQDITEEQTEEKGFTFTPPCLSRVSEDSYCDLDGPCTSKIKYCDMSAGELFGKVLWDSTIKKSDLGRYGWAANPWVWRIEFERCEKPEII